MLRTQISLTEEERKALDAESARTGKSISALIREALDERYGHTRGVAEDVALLEETFASWGDRDESGEEYVERLRSGRRPGRR